MNTRSLISVIIPCYKNAHFLPETLNSVLAQSYTNWECIIVNDGSPDSTEQVAQQYTKADSRFRYLYKENGGPSTARNLGLEVARGEFIQLLDSDDILAPTKFEESMKLFNRIDTDIVYCNFTAFIFDISDQQINRIRVKLSSNPRYDVLHKWGRSLIIPQHCPVYRRSIIAENRYDISLPAMEDVDFLFRVLRGAKVEYIDKPLCSYRNTGKSLSYNIPKMVKGIYKFQTYNFRHEGVWGKLLIIDNMIYRLGDWTVRSMVMRKNFLGQHLKVWLSEWRKDKSWLIVAIIMLPLGVLEKLCLVFYNRVLK